MALAPAPAYPRRMVVGGDDRGRFEHRLARLLDDDCGGAERQSLTLAWYRDWAEILGLPDIDVPATGGLGLDSVLPSGRAVSPLTAARCLTDETRTVRFLRGARLAVEAALRAFPGETIEVLDAGCGPFAPMALALAALYPPTTVRVTLLDAHAASLELAVRIAGRLGLSASVRGCVAADAASVRLATSPHAVICEMIQRALSHEPPVAATLNLAPQVRPGGAFLPQRIDIDGALFDAAAHYAGRAGLGPDLGRVFSLDAAALMAGAGPAMAGELDVPPHDPKVSPLCLLTRITVWGDVRLGDFEPAITLPQPLDDTAGQAARGGRLHLVYRTGADPGLRLLPPAGDP